MGSFLKASKDIYIFVSDTEHVKTELNGLWLLLEIWCVVCYVENVEHQQIIKTWYQQFGVLLHNTETFLLKVTHKEELIDRSVSDTSQEIRSHSIKEKSCSETKKIKSLHAPIKITRNISSILLLPSKHGHINMTKLCYFLC